MIYSYRIDIMREGGKVGELLATSCNIRYSANADVTKAIQLVVSADNIKMNKIITKRGDLIYFNGTRRFNGTWSFSSGNAYTESYLEFDMFKDRIRPILIINDKEYSFGNYMIIASPKKMTERGSYLSIEGYDETMILKQTAITDRLFFSQGTSYLTAIKYLLTECGFVNVISDNTDATFQVDREFELGSTYLNIINKLLDEINYEHIHMEMDNQIYLKRKEVRSVADFKYSDRNNFKIITPITQVTDIYNLPNVLVGVMSNPDVNEPIVYKKENNDYGSIISIPNRGYKVVEVMYLNNIADEDTLIDYVNNKYLETTQATENIDIETEIEPNHFYKNAIQLDTSLINGLFIEMEWTISFGIQGKMNHKLERRLFV